MSSLLYHLDRAGPALVRADPAPLAVIHVRFEKAVLALLYASFRAKDIADAAFDAFGVIPDRPLGPPAAGVVFTGAARFKDNTTDRKFFPSF